jgi:tRNA(Ile)-lysidine synthase
MASSRKSQRSPKSRKRIAVALSGGLDSVVLLDTVCKAQLKSNALPADIFVFHIHHGLQKQADDWLLFCEQLAKKYKVHFDFRLLHLLHEKAQGNIEARARAERYAALTELCIDYDVEDLLLAHHQNDQAETVLLQLMRGAGVAGLAGMPANRINADHTGSITLWRPLLNQSRRELEIYAQKHQLKWIEDPSNRDSKYRRNAIRQEIIPRLEKIQPESIPNLARSATLLSEAQTLLDRLAQQDGSAMLAQGGLVVKPLLALAKTDLPAANNVLRYWLRTQGLSMPSQERIQAWWRDLNSVKASAQLEWVHDQSTIRLWRGTLQIERAGLGKWVFKVIPTKSNTLGLPAQWVTKAQTLGLIETKTRSGSEKIQIKANTPRRTLKNLFQEADVPPWQRQVPLLYIDNELIAVAGVGVNYAQLVATGKRVLPDWVVNEEG